MPNRMVDQLACQLVYSMLSNSARGGVSLSEGISLGVSVGVSDGICVGSSLGMSICIVDGTPDDTSGGVLDGESLGVLDGTPLGESVGMSDVISEGTSPSAISLSLGVNVSESLGVG